MNRKASVIDLGYVVLFLFVVAAAVLIGSAILTGWESKTAGVINTTYADAGKSALGVFNGMHAGIVVFLGLVSAILAARIGAHPAVFFLGVIVLGFVLTFAGVISNLYSSFISVEIIALEAVNYGIMNTVMENLPIIILGLGALILIVSHIRGERWG